MTADRPGDPLQGIAPERISSFLAGDLTPAEEAVLRREIAAAGGDPDILDHLQASARASARLSGESVDDEAEWQALELGLAAQATQPSQMPGVRAASRRWLVAGSAAVVVALAVFFLRSLPGSSIGWHEYTAAPGQRKTITLADGTVLALAPSTRVRVPLRFSSGDRSITLDDGEAYFAVVHNERHPFAVRVRGTVVTDIGTRFDIRSYGEDSVIRVVVAEGAVGLRGRTLRARDMATVGPQGETTIVPGVDPDTYLRWHDGELVFDHTPVARAIRELTRWYGIEIRLTDSTIGARPLTASFKDEPVTDVLDAVATAVGGHVTWRGRNAVIAGHSPQ